MRFMSDKYTPCVQTAKCCRFKQTSQLTPYMGGWTAQSVIVGAQTVYFFGAVFIKILFPWLVQAVDIGIGIGSGHVIREAGGETPFGRQRSLLIGTLSRRLGGWCRRLIPWPHQQTGVWRKLRGEIKLVKWFGRCSGWVVLCVCGSRRCCPQLSGLIVNW
jgi:hypothetical protein